MLLLFPRVLFLEDRQETLKALCGVTPDFLM